MITPLISIVIPSFNKALYIGSTLKSIFDQDYQNFEVIIMDGGSTDGSVEIIKEYANKYPDKVYWQSKKDNGQLDAINKGLKNAKGEVVTYINADDCYQKGVFTLVSKSFLKYPEALWFAGSGIIINEKDREVAKLVNVYKNICLKINYYPMLLTFNYLMQPSVFLRKDTYLKYGPFTGTKDFIMEYDLWLKIGKEKMPVILNKTLSKFRLEKNTKSKSQTNEILKEDEAIIRKYTKNPLILFIHSLNNLGRLILGKIV